MAEWSGRPLRLNNPPDVEHAPAHAAAIVVAARDVSGAELDFTPASLQLVDEILEGFRSDGAGSDDVAETLWGFGCYVGEVFVRNTDAQWIATPEQYRPIFGFPIVVQRSNGQLTNPIGKVFKRVDEGEAENLPYFYQVFTTD